MITWPTTLRFESSISICIEAGVGKGVIVNVVVMVGLRVIVGLRVTVELWVGLGLKLKLTVALGVNEGVGLIVAVGRPKKLKGVGVGEAVAD